jgi:mevalonate kinase
MKKTQKYQLVTVSAPGKVHLMGEHAVVYGKPALLAAVNLRLFVTIAPKDHGMSVHSAEPDGYIRHVYTLVGRELHIDQLPPVTITVTSQIPSGYHLGSSAAAAVAVAGAAMYFLKKIWNPAEINRIAYEAEKKQHGNPSGGDNSASTFGGFIWYRKEMEFLKTIWQMPLRLPPTLDHFYLVDTGKPLETTGEMVAIVAKNVRHGSPDMEGMFNRNEIQVKRITGALKSGDERELIDAMHIGERTLEGMGVVGRKIRPFIRSAENAGGAAKILGGGGLHGGAGFLLCYHPDPNKVKALCDTYGYPYQSVILGGEGMRLENK